MDPVKEINPVDPDDLGLDSRKLNRDLDKIKTRVFMGKNAAFLGSLMCNLTFIWSEDIETAATNGVCLWFNPRFYQYLSQESREFVLMHELWHVAYLHMLRQGDRCPDYWNQACDFVINNKLIGDEGYTIKEIEVLLDPQFNNKSAEEVYDLIFVNAPQSPQSGGAVPGKGNGGMAGDIVPQTKEDKQQAINNIVQAVQAARMAKEAGNLPGEVIQTIENFLRPKIDWRILLDRFFTELFQDDWTWARPNRRYQDMYLPSKGGDGRLEELNYYLDVSGSVTDDQVLRFNSEVKHVKDKYNPRKLNLIQFDTQIQKIDTFTDDEPFEKIVVVGRGGTSFRPVRQHIEETKPTAAIIFSDMYCEPMEPISTPVIWVAIANRGSTVPFGKIIHIED